MYKMRKQFCKDLVIAVIKLNVRYDYNTYIAAISNYMQVSEVRHN